MRGMRRSTGHGQGNSLWIRDRRRRGRRLARAAMAARTRPTISRAACSPARSAVPALLKMFERLGIKTTWFIPGHSIETFPKEMKAVADAGHEIGIHGYSHENPIAMTPRAGNRDPRQMHRAGHAALRQAADRLCRAVVGILAGDQRAAARARHQVRPFADAQRPHALLRAGRRQLDQDRLRQEAGRVDDAAEARAARPT